MKTGDEPRHHQPPAMTNIEAFKAEPIRQIELRDTEMGLISLAISQLANGSSGSLSQYDLEALKALEQRVAHW
jgi:hypothetical protein